MAVSGTDVADLMWLRAAALLCDLNGTLITAQRLDGADAVARPGVAMVLTELQGLGAPWGIVTSVGRQTASAALRAADLPLPPVLVTADDVAANKPSPEGYLAAARSLAAAPEQCLVVEDTDWGIEAGLASGARVLTVDEQLAARDDRVRLFRWADVVDVRGGPDDVVLHLR